MRAIRVHEFGGPEVLKLEELPKPQPSKGEVLVRVHAIGVNPYDTYMRAGTYPSKPPLPYTPGSDAGGIVEAVGEGVSKVKPGDRIYTAKTITGAYAEFTLALEQQVHPLPERTDFKQGAGLWVPYGTAYHALHHQAKARASDTVLVHGASGGVGIAAIQIARAMGLHVLGTAGTPKGLELVKQEGAHWVFNHRNAGYQEEILQATANRGADIILEMLANVNLSSDTKLLAHNGRVIVIGSRGEVTINPRELMSRRASIRAFTLWAITPGAKALCAMDAEPLGADIIHSVINPIDKLTGAIHIYGGDFFDAERSEWDSLTLVEHRSDGEMTRRVFEEANARYEAYKRLHAS